MQKRKSVSSGELKNFMQRLKDRPELYEQFRRILDLSDPSEGGKGLDVNMLEQSLRPQIRETGRVAIKEFAEHIEEDIAQQVKQCEQAHQREKKR